jgi:tetratricopeptide (TPR) repeat protein
LSDDKNLEDLSPEERAAWDEAQKKLRRRLSSMMLVCLMLLVPVLIGAGKLWLAYHHVHEAQDWAEAQLKLPQPDSKAYSVLGSVYLDQDKIADALPLLSKAVALESKAGDSTQDHLTFAKAQILGLKEGVAGCSAQSADQALQEALKLADKLPQGRKAATYHGAGMFYLENLKDKAKAVACLSVASQLQKDDWVDEGNGKRYKWIEISSAYAKDLAGAMQTR